MSLKPRAVEPVPEETARIARAAFPKGNVYMRMRDEWGSLYRDELFAELFSSRGQPAESAACLALVTVMQFAEGLSDRPAADAVRSRIDWKYALGLELTDRGFDASVLSEFRSRLLEGQAETLLFETLLSRCQGAGLLKRRGRQRTDSMHVLAAIGTLNRLECLGQTLRHALDTLAVVVPQWLQSRVSAEWYERYAGRFAEYRLPQGRAERQILAETLGADGLWLLKQIDEEPTTPAWLREVPAVEVLRRVWIQQFYASDQEPVRWRDAEDLPPASILIVSPYDIEARYGKKRQTAWMGYKVHLTETCDQDRPHLITDVQTTPAPVVDSETLAPIQANLAAHERLPAHQLVDTGYMSAANLVASQQTYGVSLLGPVNLDTRWQAKAQQGFEMAAFHLDWEAQTATCPQGRISTHWEPTKDRHHQPIVRIQFARSDCQTCQTREHCIRPSASLRRLTVRPQEHHQALQAARERQTTAEFKAQYAKRAGVEGTLSQGVRVGDLRRSRYIGLAKTHLHHLLTATALNLLRVGAWLAGTPHARTRRSPFAALAPTIP